jgi:signal transduction histidine kinase
VHGQVFAYSPGEAAVAVAGTPVKVPALAPVLSGRTVGTSGKVPGAAPSHRGAVTPAVARPAWGPGLAQAATKVNGTSAVVYAAVSGATESSALAAARTAMLIGLPLLLAVVAAVTWLVTRQALRPVERIRHELAAIMGSSDLSRRVPEPAAQDAIGRLARTTNQTLAALEASLEQQHRFVADASHELRNPIASLRTQLEVGAAHPVLLDVPGAVKDVARLQRLATDLLLLARLDAGERPPARARVDLGELAREQVSLARTAGGGDGNGRVPVRTGLLAEVEVAGSGRQLARVLANLIDNAQRHAATEVVVSVRAADDGRAVLEVADDGDGVPEDQRERIFERFVRLDGARSRDDGGTGLGLAIARDLARRHGGTLTTSAREGSGAVFTLELPAPPHESPASRN